MNMIEARALHVRLSTEIDRWRAEFWTCHGDSSGEDWHTILTTIERLQREIIALKEITDRRLTEDESVIFGD
jgi:hypothetical protein